MGSRHPNRLTKRSREEVEGEKLLKKRREGRKGWIC